MGRKGTSDKQDQRRDYGEMAKREHEIEPGFAGLDEERAHAEDGLVERVEKQPGEAESGDEDGLVQGEIQTRVVVFESREDAGERGQQGKQEKDVDEHGDREERQRTEREPGLTRPDAGHFRGAREGPAAGENRAATEERDCPRDGDDADAGDGHEEEAAALQREDAGIEALSPSLGRTAGERTGKESCAKRARHMLNQIKHTAHSSDSTAARD